MRFLLFTIFCLFYYSYYGQVTISGYVTDSRSKEPLPFVNIVEKGTQNGAATNVEGYFSFKVSKIPTTISLSYIGYSAKELTIVDTESETLNIQLIESGMSLSEVTITAGENPAHRIIKNVVANKKLNDPQALDQFYYKSYSKFWLTGDTTNKKATTTFPTTSEETFRLDSIIEKQHLFFQETLTERKYINNTRDNETVLAQKTSGFTNPLFALLVTQLQSFSFYDDYIGISGNKYLNPLTPASTNRYFFILEDTMYAEGGDSLFVISFRPRPNKGFEGLTGVITIHGTDWALQNVRAHPSDTSAGLIITISQEYKRYAKNSWFPVEFRARIDFESINFNQMYPRAYMHKKLFDIDLNPTLRKNDIYRTSIYIPDDASDKKNTLINQYRLDSLNEKEKRTYQVIDSLSEKGNWERNMKLFITLMTGKIPLGPIDIPINRILQFNEREGTRLGFGLRTNEKVSKHFELGGYFGYGFKDKVWKYGGDFEVFINKPNNFSLIGGYQYDIYETGALNHLTQPTSGFFENSIRKFLLKQYDQGFSNWIGFTYDPLPNVSTQIQWQNQNRQVLGSYQYYNSEKMGSPSSTFFYSELAASIRWAPGEEYVQGSFGKLNLQRSPTVLYIDYIKGLPDGGNAIFNYHKLHFTATYSIPSVVIGTSTLSLRAAKTWGNVPESKLYFGQSNAFGQGKNFWQRFGISGRVSVETMYFNEFLSDAYLDLGWRHDFKSILFAYGKFKPHIEIVNRMAIGTLNNKNYHLIVPVKTLDKPLLETGLELNRLYVSNFLAQGLGFYYRYGAQAFPTFQENFFIKITTKFTL